MTDEAHTTAQEPIAQSMATVWVVICIAHDGEEVRHIFSSPERAQEFADADKGRGHVIYDYVLDFPERYEGAPQ